MLIHKLRCAVMGPLFYSIEYTGEVVPREVDRRSRGGSLVTNPLIRLLRREMRPPLLVTRLVKATEKVTPESTESARSQNSEHYHDSNEVRRVS